YVNEICEKTAANGFAIEVERIKLPSGYRDGAVVAPLDFEPDEFCGVWFVQFGLAINRKFAVHRLDLGQARFRYMAAADVRHPEAIKKNAAEVKRDDLIEALDERFGPDQVNIAGTSKIDAMQIWQRLWPCDVSTRLRDR
ncbi:MAG: hypothetical protein WA425_21755, partial [Xanthobacteraceae bacterium]